MVLKLHIKWELKLSPILHFHRARDGFWRKRVRMGSL